MSLVVTTEILHAFVPHDATTWGCEMAADGKTFKPCAKPGKGAPRFFNLLDLSAEWIDEHWGSGAEAPESALYRITFYKGERHRIVAQSKPFLLGLDGDAEDEEDQSDDDDDDAPDQAAQPAAARQSPPRAAASGGVPASAAPHLSAAALRALAPEQLLALFGGASRDESSIGILERLYGLHNHQFSLYATMVRAESDRQVLIAQSQVERTRIEEQARASLQVEQARMFYERLGQVEAAAREREIAAEAAAAEGSEQFGEIQDQIEQLANAHNATILELTRAAEAAGVDGAQQNQLIAAFAPAIPKLLEAIVERYGGPAAGQAAHHVASAAAQQLGAARAQQQAAPVVTPPPPRVSAADFFGSMQRADAAAE